MCVCVCVRACVCVCSQHCSSRSLHSSSLVSSASSQSTRIATELRQGREQIFSCGREEGSSASQSVSSFPQPYTPSARVGKGLKPRTCPQHTCMAWRYCYSSHASPNPLQLMTYVSLRPHRYRPCARSIYCACAKRRGVGVVALEHGGEWRGRAASRGGGRATGLGTLEP